MLIEEFKLRGIDVVESGKNVMRGHFAVKCPVCMDDPSAHLNVKYDGSHILCFRCGLHLSNKKSILWFLFRYFGIRYVDGDSDYLMFDEKGKVGQLSEYDRQKNLLKFLKKCRRIKTGDRYWNYLVHKRGLYPGFIEFFGFYEIGDEYVWIPVRDSGDVVVTMIGRCIEDSNDMRYVNLSKEYSVKTGREVLFGLAESEFLYGSLQGKWCVIVEGVFDCLKLLQIGLPAVGMLGKDVSKEQLLKIAVQKFNAIVYVPDSDVDSGFVLRIKERLSQYCEYVFSIDVNKNWGVKDVGELEGVNLMRFRDLIKEYVTRYKKC